MTRAEILAAAHQAVTVDRAASHGDARRSFALIAHYWSGHLGVPVSASDVAAMLILLKSARLRFNSGHMDSWVDVAGYAACGGEIAAGQPDRDAAS